MLEGVSGNHNTRLTIIYGWLHNSTQYVKQCNQLTGYFARVTKKRGFFSKEVYITIYDIIVKKVRTLTEFEVNA